MVWFTLETFGPAAYIVKARVQLMRDLGATPAPQNSFLLNVGYGNPRASHATSL